jgi:hypothetical protein
VIEWWAVPGSSDTNSLVYGRVVWGDQVFQIVRLISLRELWGTYTGPWPYLMSEVNWMRGELFKMMMETAW